MDDNSGSEIIDFDDEYSENENQKVKKNSGTPNNNIEEINDQIEQSNKDNQQIIEEEENQAIAPQEEENNENVFEENIIYDPKVKELNEIDINNKQAIIDILMQDSLITKKKIKNDSKREKSKNKYADIESKMNKNNLEELSKKIVMEG